MTKDEWEIDAYNRIKKIIWEGFGTPDCSYYDAEEVRKIAREVQKIIIEQRCIKEYED